MISPGRIAEDVLMPPDHVFEIVMEEIEEIIGPKGVVKKPESKELSNEEGLENLLMEEVPKSGVGEVRAAAKESNDSQKHGQK